MADPTRGGPRFPTPEPLPELPTVIDRRPRARPLATPPPPSDPSTRIRLVIHPQPPVLDKRLVLAADPNSKTAAGFRALRRRLLEHGDPRVIATTSASIGEGKTTCAANLALALGESARARVLLIEANLRAPALAALFGFAPPECFARQLAKHREKPLEPWLLVEAYWPWLHVGAVRPDAAPQPLAGAAVAIAVERMRLGGYDYVVIDGPSIDIGPDIHLVEEAADAVVVTAMAGKSTGRGLRRAVEQLAPDRVAGIALLGG